VGKKSQETSAAEANYQSLFIQANLRMYQIRNPLFLGSRAVIIVFDSPLLFNTKIDH